MGTIVLRKGNGVPGVTLADAEPAVDMTPATPRLYVGINGAPVLLADPAYIAALEARIAQLELALRELQFTAWTGQPTYVITP